MTDERPDKAPLLEYRRYEAMPGRMRDLVARFDNVTIPIWKRLGIRHVGFWQAVVGDSQYLHYLIAWQSMAEREERWSAFQADPEWKAKKAESEERGVLVSYAHNEFWRPTSFS